MLRRFICSRERWAEVGEGRAVDALYTLLASPEGSIFTLTPLRSLETPVRTGHFHWRRCEGDATVLIPDAKGGDDCFASPSPRNRTQTSDRDGLLKVGPSMICVGMANLTENWISFLQFLPIKTLPAVRLIMGVRGGAGLGRPAGAALSPALSVQGASSMAIAMLFGSQLVLMSVDDPLKTEPEDQRMTPYGHCLWHRARRCIMDVALRLACCTVRVYAYTWYARCWVAWYGSTEHCECQMHAATRLETSHSTLSRRGSDRMCRRFPAPPRPGPLPPCTPPLHAFASAVQYAPRRVCKWTINSMLPPLHSRGSRTTWTCRLASARSKTATRSRTSVTSCCPVRAALRAPQSCCQRCSAVLRRVPSLSDHSACNLLRCADRLSPCASEYPEYAGTRCSICLSALSPHCQQSRPSTD